MDWSRGRHEGMREYASEDREDKRFAGWIVSNELVRSIVERTGGSVVSETGPANQISGSSEDFQADEMVKSARWEALAAGRPQIAEMLALIDREVFAREADARARWKAYGQQTCDPVWTRQLVTFDALARFLRLCDANQAAISAVLRNPEAAQAVIRAAAENGEGEQNG